MAHFRSLGHDVVAATRAELDLTVHAEVMRVVSDMRPAAIVNCAAYNDVDAAEAVPSVPLEVNAFAVRSLARAARACGAVLVHYSTDFVFEGPPTRTAPYTEEDVPSPASHYGLSKLLGEWFAAEAPRQYVFRVESLFGGPAPRSSIDRIIAAFEAGREVRVFEDRVITPTAVQDVAVATGAALAQHLPFGLYHCVNRDPTTFLEVAREVARLGGYDPALIVPIKVADVKMRARRPQYCALSNAKLAEAGVDMPSWREAVARYFTARKNAAGDEVLSAGA